MTPLIFILIHVSAAPTKRLIWWISGWCVYLDNFLMSYCSLSLNVGGYEEESSAQWRISMVNKDVSNICSKSRWQTAFCSLRVVSLWHFRKSMKKLGQAGRQQQSACVTFPLPGLSTQSFFLITGGGRYIFVLLALTVDVQCYFYCKLVWLFQQCLSFR